MSKFELEYQPFGPHAILINWPQKIDPGVLEDVLKFKNVLDSHYPKSKVDIISSYCSITICYRLTIVNIYDEISALKQLYSSLKTELSLNRKLITIPVCYDLDFALDLNKLSTEKSLKVEEIINLHTAEIYTVYLIGFLPGFTYLGGLNPKLFSPRLPHPRPEVEAGSVAIGEQQTGIYPTSSPGGWKIIGRTPVKLFNPKSENPCPLKPGDKIRFESINRETFEDIKEMQSASHYKIKSQAYDQS